MLTRKVQVEKNASAKITILKCDCCEKRYARIKFHINLKEFGFIFNPETDITLDEFTDEDAESLIDSVEENIQPLYDEMLVACLEKAALLAKSDK